MTRATNRARGEARAENGDRILACPGCGAWPVRESWLEPHACGLKVCRVCREEGACSCVRLAAIDAVERESAELAELWGAR